MAKRPSARRAKTSLRQVVAAAPVLLGAAIALAVVTQVSIAGEFRSFRPQVALAVLPYDAEARSRLAGALTAGAPSAPARQAAAALARDAINRDPLSPVALRATGLALAGGNQPFADAQQTLRIMRQAERLSRRDQMTQLWLVNYHLTRNDVPSVVRHFDIALRTSISGRETLFPLLTTAAADRRLADAIVERLKQRPIWAKPFWNYLFEGPVSPDTATHLAMETLDPRVAEEAAVGEALLKRLSAQAEYGHAWDLYRHFGYDKRVGARLLDEGDFEGAKGLAPFTWELTQGAGLWAAREPREDGRGTALRLVAEAGEGGELARQLLHLSAGNYRLSATVGSIAADLFERPELSVRCADDSGRRLAAVKPSGGAADRQQVSASFAVPEDCRFQWLSVSLSGQLSQSASSEAGSWIDEVSIAAVQS